MINLIVAFIISLLAYAVSGGIVIYLISLL